MSASNRKTEVTNDMNVMKIRRENSNRENFLMIIRDTRMND